MQEVRIYTTTYCGYCSMAKRLLKHKGVTFKEIDVTDDAETRRWLVQVTGRRTVPQIFIGDKPYGGFTDMVALDQQGKLDLILGIRAS